MWLYKPLSNIVHLSVCCFCVFMFYHFIDLSCSVSVASKKPGQRLANSRKHSMKHKFRDVCVCVCVFNVLGISAQRDCYLLVF